MPAFILVPGAVAGTEDIIVGGTDVFFALEDPLM